MTEHQIYSFIYIFSTWLLSLAEGGSDLEQLEETQDIICLNIRR